VIERTISWVCARRCLRGADAEDFGSVVKSRLIENDYEVLARFEGRSSLKTYLVAVVSRMYLDFQVHRFGKWRSSAEARRLGTVAVRLECLVYRDGLTFDEACGVLQGDARIAESREALHSIWLRLPQRSRRQEIEGVDPVAPDRPCAGLERTERQALADRTFSAIRRSVARLPVRDRLFMRLHLEAGLTVAEVSRTMSLDQKALYRRKDEILKTLRADLEAEGIGRQEARDLLSDVDWDVVLAAEEPSPELLPEVARPRPSQVRGDTVPPGTRL
jgi:RNA polymerase sigma factor (sigma-70 family)